MSQVNSNQFEKYQDYLSRRSSKERLQFSLFNYFRAGDSFLENLPYFSKKYAYVVIYVKSVEIR